ncbi:MAG: hypothetical protein WD830_02570 [Chloroflexota bacterium]
MPAASGIAYLCNLPGHYAGGMHADLTVQLPRRWRRRRGSRLGRPAHDEHRAAGVEHDVARHATQHQPAESGTAVRADDDQLRLVLYGQSDQCSCRGDGYLARV